MTSSPTDDRTPTRARQLKIFIVAGEHSGDALGGKLMHALNASDADPASSIRYQGVGGENMRTEGLDSLFPIEDVAVMGPLQILKNLPRLSRRVYQTINAALKFNPDVVVIIDSPEFTHPIAKRIRRRAPTIPIINFVSPSIWAWRPGRARKMKPYVDHVLALLPFEPQEHIKHGGPPCTYVGHPLAERENWIRNLDTDDFAQQMGLSHGDAVITVLPGSRTSEVRLLMEPFGKTLGLLKQRGHEIKVVVPVVKNLAPLIKRHALNWPVQPRFIETEDDKYRAFKISNAALAASGTVTLELAMAGTPSVVAYRVDGFAAYLRSLVNVQSIVLANLVLGKNTFPEYVQEQCDPKTLADAVEPLLTDTPERRVQTEALETIHTKMAFKGASPSYHAAKIVSDFALKRHDR